MLSVRKRMEVKVLLRKYKPPVVARLADVSLSSVKRIAKEVDVFLLDDAAERRRRRIGRPSKVERFRWSIVEMLDSNPDIRSVDVLRRVRLMGYTGGKTTLYTSVASLRAERDRIRAEIESRAHESSATSRMRSFGVPLRH
jgi:hypothetical protein